MKEVTSAMANKLLKQLNEEKEYWEKLEKERCIYIVANNEQAVIPEYDFSTVSNTLSEINEKIIKIKHAINEFNLRTVLNLKNGKQLHIDEALVSMAMLSKRKAQMEVMRCLQTKTRINDRYVRSNAFIEYRCINFEPDDVKREYKDVCDEIIDIQIQLDRVNQTKVFSVDI